MSALPTRLEKEAGRPLTPLQIVDRTAARETTLSRLLMFYISTGLLFILLPGQFRNPRLPGLVRSAGRGCPFPLSPK